MGEEFKQVPPLRTCPALDDSDPADDQTTYCNSRFFCRTAELLKLLINVSTAFPMRIPRPVHRLREADEDRPRESEVAELSMADNAKLTKNTRALQACIPPEKGGLSS